MRRSVFVVFVVVGCALSMKDDDRVKHAVPDFGPDFKPCVGCENMNGEYVFSNSKLIRKTKQIINELKTNTKQRTTDM